MSSQASAEPQSLPCHHCGKSTNVRCSHCQIIHYCNRDCQKIMWKSHKAFCKTMSSMDVTGRGIDKSTCVIIDGLGPLGPDSDFLRSTQHALQVWGVPTKVLDIYKGRSQLVTQIACLLKHPTKLPGSILMLGWGSGDEDFGFSKSTEFREAVVEWCKVRGGRFLVQGERTRLFGRWPQWFGLEWVDGGYFRTDHQCHAVGTDALHWSKSWYPQAKGAVTSRYNVKACMLQDVQAQDALFASVDGATTYSLVPGFGGRTVQEGSTAVAWAKVGEGTVSFFGDVNYEEPTLDIMSVIAMARDA